MPIKKIFFLVIFLSFKAYSLDFNEQLETQIISIDYNLQRLLLNVGKSDDINENEILKLFKNTIFISEIVCLFSTEHLSEWVIHYDYGPLDESLQKSDEVVLYNPYRKKQPKEIYNLDKKEENSLLISYLKRQKVIENFHEKNYEQSESEREELLDSAKYPEYSFGGSLVNIKSAPIEFTTPYKTKNITIGASLENKDQLTKVIMLDFSTNIFSYEDPSSKLVSSRNITSFSAFYENNNFIESAANIMHFDFKKDQRSDVNPILSEFAIGPFGIGYRKKNSYALGVVPQLNFYKGEMYDPLYNVTNVTETSIRYKFYFEFKTKINSHVTIDGKFVFKPNHNLSKNTFDIKNNNFLMFLNTHTQLTEKIFLTYRMQISWDQRRKTYLNFPSTEWTNGIYFNYEFIISDFEW